MFAYAIFIVGAEIHRTFCIKRKIHLYNVRNLLGVFLFININVSCVLIINRVFNYQFVSEQINRISDSHMRFQNGKK